MKYDYESPQFRRQLKKATKLSLESAVRETISRASSIPNSESNCESSPSKSESSDSPVRKMSKSADSSPNSKFSLDYESPQITIFAPLLLNSKLPNSLHKSKIDYSSKKKKELTSTRQTLNKIKRSPDVTESSKFKPKTSDTPSKLRAPMKPSKLKRSLPTVVSPKSQRKFNGISKISPSTMVRRLSASSSDRSPSSQQPLIYQDSRKFIDVVIDNDPSRLNIAEKIEVVSDAEHRRLMAEDLPTSEKHTPSRPYQRKKGDGGASSAVVPMVAGVGHQRLNVAVIRPVEGCEGERAGDVWTRSDDLYGFKERSVEEATEDVEYDLDEEDVAWLALLNAHRAARHHPSISPATLERLLDRLEKEAFLVADQSAVPLPVPATTDPSPDIDADAVCAICLDDESQVSNAILFCDRCDLAVHQDCYGVPYVPEGEWLCRKCQRSPARTVHCALCPRIDGAFKQTDDGGWCHVLCALWIPEVGFGSVESLEPITKVDKVPPARRRLACAVCAQREAGACIQCMRKNCYTAFHVSCAQQTGVYMKIEPVHVDGVMVNVHKTFLCDAHRPPDSHPFEPMIDNSVDSDSERPSEVKHKVKVKLENGRMVVATKAKLKKGVLRKEKGKVKDEEAMPAVPVIPVKRLERIARLERVEEELTLPARYELVAVLRNYWTLKRGARRGLPLLRRLQACTAAAVHDLKQTEGGDKARAEIIFGLQTLRRLRNEMEKVRLLLELIRKRERLKKELAMRHHILVHKELMLRGLAHKGLLKLGHVKKSFATHQGLLKNGLVSKGFTKKVLVNKGFAKNSLVNKGFAKNNLVNKGFTKNDLVSKGLVKNGLIKKGLLKKEVTKSGLEPKNEKLVQKEGVKGGAGKRQQEKRPRLAIDLGDVLDQLQEKDKGDIFAQPVDTTALPEYLEKIKRPMDFSTMRAKLDRDTYSCVGDLARDFALMISNCLRFNAKDTAYYRLALKLRKKGNMILVAAKALEYPSGGTETKVLDFSAGSETKVLDSSNSGEENSLKSINAMETLNSFTIDESKNRDSSTSTQLKKKAVNLSNSKAMKAKAMESLKAAKSVISKSRKTALAPKLKSTVAKKLTSALKKTVIKKATIKSARVEETMKTSDASVISSEANDDMNSALSIYDRRNQTLRSNPYRNWVSNKRRKLMVHRSLNSRLNKDVDLKAKNLPSQVNAESRDFSNDVNVKSESELDVTSQKVVSDVDAKSQDVKSYVGVESMDSVILAHADAAAGHIVAVTADADVAADAAADANVAAAADVDCSAPLLIPVYECNVLVKAACKRRASVSSIRTRSSSEASDQLQTSSADIQSPAPKKLRKTSEESLLLTTSDPCPHLPALAFDNQLQLHSYAQDLPEDTKSYHLRGNDFEVIADELEPLDITLVTETVSLFDETIEYEPPTIEKVVSDVDPTQNIFPILDQHCAILEICNSLELSPMVNPIVPLVNKFSFKPLPSIDREDSPYEYFCEVPDKCELQPSNRRAESLRYDSVHVIEREDSPYEYSPNDDDDVINTKSLLPEDTPPVLSPCPSPFEPDDLSIHDMDCDAPPVNDGDYSGDEAPPLLTKSDDNDSLCSPVITMDEIFSRPNSSVLSIKNTPSSLTDLVITESMKHHPAPLDRSSTQNAQSCQMSIVSCDARLGNCFINVNQGGNQSDAEDAPPRLYAFSADEIDGAEDRPFTTLNPVHDLSDDDTPSLRHEEASCDPALRSNSTRKKDRPMPKIMSRQRRDRGNLFERLTATLVSDAVTLETVVMDTVVIETVEEVVVGETDSSCGSACSGVLSDSDTSRSKCSSPEYRAALHEGQDTRSTGPDKSASFMAIGSCAART